MSTNAEGDRPSPIPTPSAWHEELELMLLALDDAPVECDCMTYAISHLLDKAGIHHRCMMGHVEDRITGIVVAPHLWVELCDGWVIDLRLRMWLGDDDRIPHGVFRPEVYPEIAFEGKPRRRIGTISETALDEITEGRLSHVKVPAGFAQENSNLRPSPNHQPMQ